MKSIMITAPASNSGKTIVTLGIIRALKNKGIDVSAFKSGPDFIDTKYIGIASGKNAGNLDMHLMGRNGIYDSLSLNFGEMAVIEGAMGYFDGIYNTYENSAFDISRELDIPAILVYTPKGEMFTSIPKIKGMVDFSNSRIKGVIFNKVSESIYKLLKEKIEEHLNIEVLGYLPEDEMIRIENRHLGLIQPAEISSIEKVIDKAANLVQEKINLKSIINLSKEIEVMSYCFPTKKNIRISIAHDKAFNFYYSENVELLKNICNVEFFSPIKDKMIPKSDLVYIGGGYPEIYAKELSQNTHMINSIRSYVEDNGFLYAEGGGLMYLMDSINENPMCSIFRGKSIMTNRLQRFGYVNMQLKEDTIIGNCKDRITGHEFHKSIIETEEEEVLNITKPMSKRNWQCGYTYKNVLGMYQHINFLGNMKAFNHLLERIEKNTCNHQTARSEGISDF